MAEAIMEQLYVLIFKSKNQVDFKINFEEF